jgi:ABC-type nitrate/sulfonate/bicarbonate transport system permease component
MAASASASTREIKPPVKRGIKRERIIQIVVVIAFLIAWEIAGRRLGVFIMAPPSSLLAAFGEMLQTGELSRALGESITVLLLGYVIGAAIGISLGFIMGTYKSVATILDPFISALYVVPIAAIVPLLIVWTGIGMTPRVLTVTLFAIFEILISTYTGVRGVNPRLIEMGRAFGANQGQLFRHVVFFGALPVLFAGLRIGAGRAVKGMVLAELLFAVTGLGGLVMTNSHYYRTDKVMVIVVIIALLGVILVSLVQLIERKLAPWWHH